MSSGPSGFSRQKPPPAADPATAAAADPTLDPAADPLLGSPDQPPPPPQPPSEAQRPRGHRQRRTTLPRATRGWSRGIVWSLIGLTVFATIYGLVARIDSSIESPGRLKPAGGLTAVSAPFSTLVLKVLVKEGQRVRAGQPLVLLRVGAIEQQRRQLLAIRAAWLKEVALLSYQLGLPANLPADPASLRQLEVSQQEVNLRTQAALEESARDAINTRQQLSDLQGLRSKLAINHQITERMRKLQHEGGISRLDLDRQREREIELVTALRRTQEEVKSGRRREREGIAKAQQIPVANSKLLFTTLDNARQQLRESNSRLVEVNERIALSRLTAPVAGQVFNLSVRPGEMTSPARPALSLVPRGALEVQVDISNRDVGFVRIGMPVEVRVASFPFTEYGSLKGTLVRLSADAMPADPTHPQEYFQGTVRLKSSSLRRDGVEYTLRPGMAVTGLLQLGPRPVISLLGDRITSFLDSPRSIR